jgi:hypothetical protein
VIRFTIEAQPPIYLCDKIISLVNTFVPSAANLENYFTEDSRFRQLYPLSLQKLDKLHWSPLRVINRAVKFLVNKPNAKISILVVGQEILPGWFLY